MYNTPTAKSFGAANITLLVYDYLLTFTDEVSTVWSCPLSIGIFLFYLNRYLPLIDMPLFLYYGQANLNASKCAALFHSATWLSIVAANSAHTIVFLQTCALWENQWLVKSFLLFLLVVTGIIFLVVKGLHMHIYKFLEPWDTPAPALPGCRLTMSHSYAEYIYMMVLVSQACTVGLMLYKGVQHVRQSRDSWVIGLYRNGVLYCVVILLLSLANVLIPKVPAWSRTYASLLTPFQHTMESILCNRVMFIILKRRKSTNRSDTHSMGRDESTGVFTSVLDSYRTEGTSAMELESVMLKPSTNATSTHLP